MKNILSQISYHLKIENMNYFRDRGENIRNQRDFFQISYILAFEVHHDPHVIKTTNNYECDS